MDDSACKMRFHELIRGSLNETVGLLTDSTCFNASVTIDDESDIIDMTYAYNYNGEFIGTDFDF